AAPQAQEPERREALAEQAQRALLQRSVEVDEDVPAQDDVELAERGVGREVVLREQDVLAQARMEQRRAVARGVILAERARATRLLVRRRILAHAGERKDARAGAVERLGVHVRG